MRARRRIVAANRRRDGYRSRQTTLWQRPRHRHLVDGQTWRQLRIASHGAALGVAALRAVPLLGFEAKLRRRGRKMDRRNGIGVWNARI